MWGKVLSPPVSVLIPEGGAWEELDWLSLHLGSHLVLTPWTLLCAAFPPLLYAHCLPLAHFSSCSSCLWPCRLSSGILSTLPCVLPVVLRSIAMWNRDGLHAVDGLVGLKGCGFSAGGAHWLQKCACLERETGPTRACFFSPLWYFIACFKNKRNHVRAWARILVAFLSHFLGLRKSLKCGWNSSSSWD